MSRLPNKNLLIRIPKTASTAMSKMTGVTSNCHALLRNIHWEKKKDAFIFTCTRHPYDRFLSAFGFMDGSFKNENFNNVSKCIDRILGHNGRMSAMSVVYRPQWTFVSNRQGLLGVDYVIRYENLEEDWKHVSQVLYSQYKPLPVKNKTKKRLSVEDLSTEDKEKLDKIYAIDFEKFGYEKG